jgi:hypothetical protein
MASSTMGLQTLMYCVVSLTLTVLIVAQETENSNKINVNFMDIPA